MTVVSSLKPCVLLFVIVSHSLSCLSGCSFVVCQFQLLEEMNLSPSRWVSVVRRELLSHIVTGHEQTVLLASSHFVLHPWRYNYLCGSPFSVSPHTSQSSMASSIPHVDIGAPVSVIGLGSSWSRVNRVTENMNLYLSVHLFGCRRRL